MSTPVWDKANTVAPSLLLAEYEKRGMLSKARYHYETWRKTTAMVNPPAAWDDLDIRMKVALCAVTYQTWQFAEDEFKPETC